MVLLNIIPLLTEYTHTHTHIYIYLLYFKSVTSNMSISKAYNHKIYVKKNKEQDTTMFYLGNPQGEKTQKNLSLIMHDLLKYKYHHKMRHPLKDTL